MSAARAKAPAAIFGSLQSWFDIYTPFDAASLVYKAKRKDELRKQCRAAAFLCDVAIKKAEAAPFGDTLDGIEAGMFLVRCGRPPRPSRCGYRIFKIMT
jgi:hypothetical protein